MTAKVKLAVIRGDGVRSCPFGLSIPAGCKYVGNAIHRMASLSEKGTPEENEKIAKSNKLVFAYHKENKPCVYADKILEGYDKVDCDFGDTGQGFHSVPFVGSPLYPQTFHGIGLDGLYGYPLGFYADNNESRNLFLGLFSLLGSATPEQIVKLADDYDKSGEKEKANAIDNLLGKLNDLKRQYGETFIKVENFLKDKKL